MEAYDSMDAYEVAGGRRSAAWCLQYEYEYEYGASLGVTTISHLAWCSLANLVDTGMTSTEHRGCAVSRRGR